MSHTGLGSATFQCTSGQCKCGEKIQLQLAVGQTQAGKLKEVTTEGDGLINEMSLSGTLNTEHALFTFSVFFNGADSGF